MVEMSMLGPRTIMFAHGRPATELVRDFVLD